MGKNPRILSVPLLVLSSQIERTVISTEAAHSLIVSGERRNLLLYLIGSKFAPRTCRCLPGAPSIAPFAMGGITEVRAVAVAFLVAIPTRNLLLSLYRSLSVLSSLTNPSNRHFDRSASRFHREARSGEICFCLCFNCRDSQTKPKNRYLKRKMLSPSHGLLRDLLLFVAFAFFFRDFRPKIARQAPKPLNP